MWCTSTVACPSSANIPGTRAQKTRHPRNKNYEKYYNEQIKERNSEMRKDTNDTKMKEHVLRTC